MKKVVLAIGLMMSILCVKAQKVDLDKFNFEVAVQRLPTQPVPLEQRTFGTRVKLGAALNSYVFEGPVNERINISGWKRVSENPTIGIEFSLDDFVFRGAETKKEVSETKDKNGVVTSSTTYYWIEATYSGRGICKYKAPYTAPPLSEKEIAEAKQKAEQKATNRFLANVQMKAPETPADGARTVNLNQDIIYKSDKTSNGTSEISEKFKNNKDAIYGNNLRQFSEQAINQVNGTLNSQYGYTPVSYREFLWILDSKDHPEYQTQQEAIQAVKALFQTMKADEPLDVLAANLQPLMDYFESLKTKYTGDNKPDRKMRYSAYYNLSKIYYYLDQPEKSIKEADGLIANGYDERDGEKMIESAKQLRVELNTAKLASRHNSPQK